MQILAAGGKGRLLVGAAGLSLLLGGCSAATTSGPTLTSSAPTATSTLAAPNSEEEANALMAGCMGERGWTARSDGGYDATAEQSDKLVSDISECSADVDASVAPWDDADWEAVYAENVDSAECVAGLGFDVPTQPSLQVFKDAYYTDSIWDPYQYVPADEVQQVIADQCPLPELIF